MISPNYDAPQAILADRSLSAVTRIERVMGVAAQRWPEKVAELRDIVAGADAVARRDGEDREAVYQRALYSFRFIFGMSMEDVV
ncbi:MAG: hypothetical protein ACYTF0_02170 [Planctomycetota bacterium]|jgi:hypothetical protein